MDGSQIKRPPQGEWALDAIKKIKYYASSRVRARLNSFIFFWIKLKSILICSKLREGWNATRCIQFTTHCRRRHVDLSLTEKDIEFQIGQGNDSIHFSLVLLLTKKKSSTSHRTATIQQPRSTAGENVCVFIRLLSVRFKSVQKKGKKKWQSPYNL